MRLDGAGALFLGLALGTAALAFRLGGQSYWWDEHVTLMFTRVDWPTLMVDFWGLDTHRPVYYGLQKAWNGVFGESLAATRALPGALMLAAGAAIFAAARKLGPPPFALVTLCVFVTSPMFIYQGRELRNYGLMNLGLALALWCLVLLLARARRGELRPGREETTLWAGFAAAMALAFYAHSTAIFVAAVLGLWILGATLAGAVPRRFLWGGLAAGGLFTLLVVPALIPFFGHLTGTLGDTFWVPPISAGWVYGQTLTVYAYPQWLKPVMAVMILWGAWSLRRRPAELSLLLALVVGFPLLVLAISLFKPIFMAKVIAWSGLSASFLIAAGILALKGPLLRGAGLAVVAAAQIGGLALFYPDPPESEPYPAFAPLLERFDPAGDRLVLGTRLLEPAMRWHYPELVDGEVLAFNYSDSQQNVIDDAFLSRFVRRRAARRMVVEHQNERLFVLRETVPQFRVSPRGDTDRALAMLTEGRPLLAVEEVGALRLELYGLPGPE